MKSAIAALSCLAGLAALTPAAHAQLMRILVSTNGSTFTNNVNANPGDTVQVLVTVSYLGTSTAVAGFGSANFQPTVSNWHAADTLLPMLQGGNNIPADGSGMVRPQFYLGSTNGAGPHVYSDYTPGTYGRVYPMGRTYLNGDTALTGFVHNNPDGSGRTYLRIAQASNPNWIGQAGNTSGSSGVNCAQLYVVGRTTSDPDFWGNQESTDPGDPFPWPRDPALDYRRINVEIFRFAFTLDSSTTPRTMTVDAPLDGQQINANGLRYIGFFSNPSQSAPGTQLEAQVLPGFVNVVPTPSSLFLLGLSALPIARRRKR